MFYTILYVLLHLSYFWCFATALLLCYGGGGSGGGGGGVLLPCSTILLLFAASATVAAATAAAAAGVVYGSDRHGCCYRVEPPVAAYPHFPPQFLRRRLQDFVYFQRKHTKIMMEGISRFLAEGRHFSE